MSKSSFTNLKNKAKNAFLTAAAATVRAGGFAVALGNKPGTGGQERALNGSNQMAQKLEARKTPTP